MSIVYFKLCILFGNTSKFGHYLTSYCYIIGICISTLGVKLIERSDHQPFNLCIHYDDSLEPPCYLCAASI